MMEIAVEMSKPNILSLFFPPDCTLDRGRLLLWLILVECTVREIMLSHSQGQGMSDVLVIIPLTCPMHTDFGGTNYLFTQYELLYLTTQWSATSISLKSDLKIRGHQN